MICISIDNVSSNTVGGRCYSAHQDVGIFAEDHIDMVSCVRLQLVAGDRSVLNKTNLL